MFPLVLDDFLEPPYYFFPTFHFSFFLFIFLFEEQSILTISNSSNKHSKPSLISVLEISSFIRFLEPSKGFKEPLKLLYLPSLSFPSIVFSIYITVCKINAN